MADFSERYINGLKPDARKDRWESDDKSSAGPYRLQIRIRPNGAKLWYVRVRTDGRDIKQPLGAYLRPDNPLHMSLADARQKAFAIGGELALSTEMPPREPKPTTALEVPARESSQASAPEIPASPVPRTHLPQSKPSGEELTFADVAENYAVYLQTHKTSKSGGQVRSSFKLNVAIPYPEVARLPASQLTTDQATDLVRKVLERGGSRHMADKFRRVMSTAFSRARGAATDPNIPAGKSSGIATNPFSDVMAVEGGTGKARDRVVSNYELAATMRGLNGTAHGPAKAAMELLIRMGGQRCEQLLRLRRNEVNLEKGQVTLFDGKGRRKKPRPHVVPTTPHMIEILVRQLETAKILDTEFMFTSNGKGSLNAQTVGDEFIKLVAKIRENDPAVGEFRLSDIRRTVETFLAPTERNTPSIVRSHLHSHNLGGVQQVHYDRYEYFDEKRDALMLWNNHLDALLAMPSGSVMVEESTSTARMPETIEVNAEMFKQAYMHHLMAGTRLK